MVSLWLAFISPGLKLRWKKDWEDILIKNILFCVSCWARWWKGGKKRRRRRRGRWEREGERERGKEREIFCSRIRKYILKCVTWIFCLVIASCILYICHPFWNWVKDLSRAEFKLYRTFLRATLIVLSQFGTAYERGLARTSFVELMKYFAILGLHFLLIGHALKFLLLLLSFMPWRSKVIVMNYISKWIRKLYLFGNSL